PMKRASELVGLSKDHHRALVIAKRAKTASGEMAADIWHEMETYYSTELEIHFAIEETYIAAHLEALGETELVEEFYDDHRKLRAYFEPGSTRTANDLSDFGQLLEQHVRFEERQLFRVAQELLGPDALAAIERACSEQGL
ncbi:MAG: hemerythrin domain-containing protein, partial [Aestuariibacter sp.]|nr:hemerythrin domain-containing protein [Aestuariibacter sp.]